jgi:hypothetical protein
MTNENRPQAHILTHAVLVGLTPLIPIPVLDDLAKAYFLRRMTRSLAARRGAVLPDSEVAALVDEPDSGCLAGCIGTVVIYPVKKIFRKIFFFLEVKRAVDLTSAAFHRGLLVDHALAIGAIGGPTGLPVEAVRSAIDGVLRTAGTQPVENAIRLTFRQSMGALRSAAETLQSAIQRVPKSSDLAEVARAVEPIEAEEERALGGVTDVLRARIESLPGEYFDRLYADLRARLGR